jgi:hypothetical protein
MPRKLFAGGSRGEIVGDIQRALLAAGHDPQGIDEIYGGQTAAAVRSFQQANGLPVTGAIDDATWTALLNRPIPGTDLRSLQLTAAFEGHGYTLAQGNFDGAWLTWGIIGFTMKFGGVQRIILEIQSRFPDLVQAAFGQQAGELIRIMRAPRQEQKEWADSVTVAGSLAEPWRSGFARLGAQPPVREEQQRLAKVDYYNPAEQTARRFGLRSELGLALCFDVHVQNGGISSDARQQIRQRIGDRPGLEERELREIIANAVADHANRQFAEDVRTRKLTIALGSGTVHGRRYVLENWGLSDVMAVDET